MNETQNLPLDIGDWVRYTGDNRTGKLKGKIGQIISVKCNVFGNPISYGVAYANMDDLV